LYYRDASLSMFWSS